MLLQHRARLPRCIVQPQTIIVHIVVKVHTISRTSQFAESVCAIFKKRGTYQRQSRETPHTAASHRRTQYLNFDNLL